jgi:hypothetical protein
MGPAATNETAGGRDQAAIRDFRERREIALDLIGIPHVDHGQLHLDRTGGLNSSQLANAGRNIWVAQNCRSRHVRGDLLQKLEPFRGQRVLKDDEAGDIAARSCQARNHAGPNGIDHVDENNRHRTSRLLQRQHQLGGRCQHDIWRERDQFSSIFPTALKIAPRSAHINPKIAAVSPAQFLQSFQERGEPRLSICIAGNKIHQHADTPQRGSFSRMSD